MKHYKQLTREQRYQISGLKIAGLNQSQIADEVWRTQVDDFSGIQMEQASQRLALEGGLPISHGIYADKRRGG
ncbi:hypothetical protein [Nitrosomonas sp.]|uniref:hypothetical protein n=1 Tax=Nitrosomonas sp. TaxID=42353 RepID=UPI0025EB22DC|nr:hypothetical protein [Nitrosomonas sp.]MBY0483717.1 hypothetical protein [Nitrosomonas sp.]